MIRNKQPKFNPGCYCHFLIQQLKIMSSTRSLYSLNLLVSIMKELGEMQTHLYITGFGFSSAQKMIIFTLNIKWTSNPPSGSFPHKQWWLQTRLFEKKAALSASNDTVQERRPWFGRRGIKMGCLNPALDTRTATLAESWTHIRLMQTLCT